MTVITEAFRVSQAIIRGSDRKNPAKPNTSTLDVRIQVDDKKVDAYFDAKAKETGGVRTDGFDRLERVSIKIPKWKTLPDGKREVEWVWRDVSFQRIGTQGFATAVGIHTAEGAQGIPKVNKQLLKRYGFAVKLEWGDRQQNEADAQLRAQRTVHAQKPGENASVVIW